jgi:hypothetical protein
MLGFVAGGRDIGTAENSLAMGQLTRIEQLDKQIPGLANEVRMWFDQGVSARAVRDLLRKQYGVSVSETLISNFRAWRWAPERLACQTRLTELAATTEFERLLAMKRSNGMPFTEVGK